jgi:hypothetical protein
MKTTTPPPATTTVSYFDSLANEWVTTFTIRHKIEPIELLKAYQPEYMTPIDKAIKDVAEASSKFNFPTLNQKDLGIKHY